MVPTSDVVPNEFVSRFVVPKSSDVFVVSDDADDVDDDDVRSVISDKFIHFFLIYFKKNYPNESSLTRSF